MGGGGGVGGGVGASVGLTTEIKQTYSGSIKKYLIKGKLYIMYYITTEIFESFVTNPLNA